MERLEGRVAVVTGGGSGMGRELVIQLAALGCHVATCDLFPDSAKETEELARSGAAPGTELFSFAADVSIESDLVRFREALASGLSTDHVNLLFNNAGIGGGASFVSDDRDEWERTFAVDWGGVYLGTRTFLPMLLAADEGHVVNTSSVNGFWASIGPTVSHTAYSTAKFAIRGFTEALITDFRLHAPHLRASVVMPGHIGTSIVINTGRALAKSPDELTPDDLSRLRERLAAGGTPVDGLNDEELRKAMQVMAERFRDTAPTSAQEAATIILDGVRANRWRILVGSDAEILDREVRSDPEHAYEVEFFDALRKAGGFGVMPAQ